MMPSVCRPHTHVPSVSEPSSHQLDDSLWTMNRLHQRLLFVFVVGSSTDAFQTLSTFSNVVSHHGRQSAAVLLSATSNGSSEPSSTLQRLPQSAVSLSLTVPPAATLAAYDKVLATVSKKVAIPGFRKGSRIPPALLENAWASQGGKQNLRSLAIQELCGELVGRALKDTYGLEPIGRPALKTEDGFRPGEQWTMEVTCDVWPDIHWKTETDVPEQQQGKPYLGIRGKYRRKPFDQQRMNAALRDLTERYAQLQPFQDNTRPLQMGDACLVNMVGYLANPDGTKGDPLPDAASGDNVEVILGQGRYMEGLVEGLVGKKVGEVVTVNVRFPAALKNKDLAAKDAIFHVEILSASTRTLPTINDEFASQVRPGLTSELLHDELRKAVDSQDAQHYLPARNEALAEALSQLLDVQVPDTLLTEQAREKYALMMTDMRSSGMPDEEIKRMITPENFLKYKELSVKEIERDFKISMALDEIARLENIKVPAYQVEEQIQSLKDQAVKEGQSEESMDEEQMRRKVEMTLERRMVYDFLAEHAVLEVEYMQEEEEKFDEELLEKLAKESLEREQSSQGKKDQERKEMSNEEVVASSENTMATVVENELSVEEVEPSSKPPNSDNSNDLPSYDGMDLEEKAFNILTNLGILEIHPDPDAPDFDASIYANEEDDE